MGFREGWHGWDEYAPFYDWENARTLGRRDVAFWQRVARREQARTLELGCGTGRLLLPVSRTGVRAVGLDRSVPMLARARQRIVRLPRAKRPALVRGDIRHLPFPDRSFGLIMAPYGLLQSLVRDRDLQQTLADVARVLRRGGLLGIDLVPDLPAWSEYSRKVSLQGTHAGGRVTLIESVRQDRRRKLTIFDEEFIHQRGRTTTRHRFSLTFRTLAVPAIVERLERAGFRVERFAGDYRGGAWTLDSTVWLLEARKR